MKRLKPLILNEDKLENCIGLFNCELIFLIKVKLV